jgi:hypothetical protein
MDVSALWKCVGAACCLMVASCNEWVLSPTPSTAKNVSIDDLRSTADLAAKSAKDGGRVLAVCGPSGGIAYYVKPTSVGWVDDTIDAGRIVFVIDAEGNPNILFKDATEKFTDAKVDGGQVGFLRKPNTSGEFSLIVIYHTGVTETYIITKEGTDWIGLNTVTKPFVESIATVTKVGVLKSKCFVQP